VENKLQKPRRSFFVNISFLIPTKVNSKDEQNPFSKATVGKPTDLFFPRYYFPLSLVSK
jgi:hypothetical protein